MLVATNSIPQPSLEQQGSGLPWPHPWNHHPFISNGKVTWLRYPDLDHCQRKQNRTSRWPCWP